MKNHLLPLLGTLLLRKRSIIETLFAKLKSGMELEYTCQRPPINGFVRTLSCLATYSLAPSKVNLGTTCHR